MRLKDIFDEFDSVGPALEWQKIVRELVSNIIRKYPTSPFGISNWQDNIDDVVSEVFAQRLLGRNSAQYIRDTVGSLSEFKALMTNEIKITIELLRIPNQADNIWDNLKLVLEELGRKEDLLPKCEDEDCIKNLLKIILGCPRLRNRGTERFSPLFAPATLRQLGKEILKLHPQMSERAIREAIRRALTIISPGLSIQSAGGGAEDIEAALLSEGLGGVSDDFTGNELVEAARFVMTKISLEESEIILRRANGDSLDLIAATLGTTRYFLKNQLLELETKIREIFAELQLEPYDYNDVLKNLLNLLGYGEIDRKLVKDAHQ